MKRILFFLLVLICLIQTGNVFAKSNEKLTVHFINVKSGDSMLLTCGGETMVVDFGTLDRQNMVFDYLTKQKIKDIKYAVCTHPHPDHMGGMNIVLKNFNVSNIMLTKCNRPDNFYVDTHSYHRTMKTIQNKGLPVIYPNPGSVYYLGKAKIQFYGPLKSYYDRINDYSLVMKVTYGKTSFLLTGDAEKPSEADMIKKYGKKLKATVLKVGHHGQAVSTSKAFLNKVKPQYAVISCGKGSMTEGNPSNSVIKRFRSNKIPVYRTDINKDIVATSDGNKIKWKMTSPPKSGSSKKKK